MSNISSFVKRLRDIMRADPGINGDAQRIEQIAWMLFLKVYDSKEEEWKALNKNYVSIIPEEIQWKNWAHEKKAGDGLSGDDLLNFVNNKVFPKLKSLSVSKETEIRKAIVKTTFEDANNYMKDGVSLRQVINVIDEIDFSDYEESHAFGEIYESILKELQSAGSSGEFYTPRAVTDFMAKMIEPKIGEKMADFACGTGGFITSWLKALEEKIKTADDQKEYASSVYGIEKKQFPYMLCVTNLLLHDVDSPKIYHDNSLIYDVLNYGDDDRFDVVLMNPPYGGTEKQDVKNHFPADLVSSETADLFMSVIMYRLKKNGRAAVIIPDGFLFGNDNAKTNLKKKLLTDFNLHTVVRMPQSVFSPYTSITTNILFFNNEEPTGKTWFYRVDMPEGIKHFSKTKPMKLSDFDDCVAWWNDRKEIADEEGNPKAKCYSSQELIDSGYNFDVCGYPKEEEEILSIKDTILNYKKHSEAAEEKINSTLAKITEILGIEL
jgi:type I restriction enzyme M protein